MNDREIAEYIWYKYKGKELEKDVGEKEIIYRYWHRAMEKD
jgi:hypothetical protein